MSRTSVRICQNVPAVHVSEKECSVPCEMVKVTHRGSVAVRRIPAAKGTDKKWNSARVTRLVYCVNYFIHFLPLIKRNAVYQSYYIHTNGHTIAVIHFVVNKSLNQAVFFFFSFPLLCGVLLLWKEVQAGRTPQLGNKTKLSNIYTRII